MATGQLLEEDGFVTAYPAMTDGVAEDPQEFEIRPGEVFVREVDRRRMVWFVRTRRS